MYVLYAFINQNSENASPDRSLDAYPPAYRERLARMRSPRARRQTQAGLDLLAHALSALGYAPTTVDRIGFSAHGKPTIAGAPAFSIAHSKTLIACAVAEQTTGFDAAPLHVGLDVEARRARVPARLGRLLNADEAAQLADEPQRFFDFWCAREATVKASGRVGFARIRSLSLAHDRAWLDRREWHLRPIAIARGYAGCIASDRAIDEITLERVAPAVSD